MKTAETHGNADHQAEQLLGNLLRWGVATASLVVLVGGIVYLTRHGAATPDYGTFHGVPSQFRSPWQILRAAFSWQGRGIIQLGLILLVLTPVARVLFSIFIFFKQRDWLYVGVTLLVLTILVFGLVGARL